MDHRMAVKEAVAMTERLHLKNSKSQGPTASAALAKDGACASDNCTTEMMVNMKNTKYNGG